MGNCCRSPAAVAREDVKSTFCNDDHGKAPPAKQKAPMTVLAGVAKENIEDRYLVDRELGQGEFGLTYLCIDRDTRELLACKSISKRKLRTAVDVEDVRREVAIMRQIVGIEGHNPSGHCFVASNLVDSIPTSIADENLNPAKKQAIDKENQPTDLLSKERELSMLGPFVDSEHPEVKRGTVEKSFDEIFHFEILRKIACIGNPGIFEANEFCFGFMTLLHVMQ